MNTRVKNLFAAIAAVMFILAATASGAEETTLTADKISYDPANQNVRAEGNVRFKRPDGELTGNVGTGNINGTSFKLEGNVRGKFPRESLSVECSTLVLFTEGKKRTIKGSGGVKVTRSGDRLSANTVTWLIDSDSYRAAGRVVGRFESHSMDADEVARDNEVFWGKGVRRYEDAKRGFSLSASSVRGRISSESSNAVTELEALGGVVINMREADGKPIRITGEKGVYSRSRGTIVVSGSAHATQQGREVKAGSLVFFLDSKRIEALDKPQIVFDLDTGQ